MLSKTGFTHSDLLCWQIDYAGGSLNVNGTIMRDTYTLTSELAQLREELPVKFSLCRSVMRPGIFAEALPVRRPS
ncbi:hypothetical protein AL479_22950 [Citrobacter amalonaticus]|nr:hypothetical protein AL479_22950 [Citrobacter amalonaticus]